MGYPVLTAPEMAILLRLSEGANSKFDLAQAGRLSPSEIPQYLERLERRGLVRPTSQVGPFDEWDLTNKGRRLRNLFVHGAHSSSDPGVFVVERDMDDELAGEELDAALERAISSSEK